MTLILNDALNCQSGGYQPSRHHICFLVIFAIVFGAQGCLSSVHRTLCPALKFQVRAGRSRWDGAPAPLECGSFILLVTEDGPFVAPP